MLHSINDKPRGRDVGETLAIVLVAPVVAALAMLAASPLVGFAIRAFRWAAGW